MPIIAHGVIFFLVLVNKNWWGKFVKSKRAILIVKKKMTGFNADSNTITVPENTESTEQGLSARDATF